jgi:CRISPR/Cas system-associated protein Cas10 (large subunit of type III CRISPR-Cas system)
VACPKGKTGWLRCFNKKQGKYKNECRHCEELRELRDSESRGDEAIHFLQTSNFDFKKTWIASSPFILLTQNKRSSSQ